MTTGGKKSPNKSAQLPDGKTIALQLIDTAWRVAVPILLFSWFGDRLDKQHHTTPAWTLTGLFLSLATAVLLVYKQIKHLYPEFFKKEAK